MPFGTLQELVPNSLVLNDGNYSGEQGGTIQGASFVVPDLADFDDNTWAVSCDTANNTKYLVIGFTSYTLATNERVYQIEAAFRSPGGPLGDGRQVTISWGTSAGGNQWTAPFTWLVASNPPATANFVGALSGSWPGRAVPNDVPLQADLDGIQVRLTSSNASNAGNAPGCTAQLMQLRLHAYIVTQPTVAVTGPSGPVLTHTPTITWAPTIGDGMPQGAFQVKIWDLALNANPSWLSPNPSYDSTIVNGTGTTHQIPPLKALPNGNYRAFVAVAKNVPNGTGHYWSDLTAHTNFSIADAPPAPTNVGPTGTIISSQPNLTATLAKSTFPGALNVRARWQLASDSAFTANVLTIDESSTAANGGGVHSYSLTNYAPPTRLAQHLWFLQAAAVDTGGAAGPWSTASQFTVSHPPTVSNPRPAAGVSIPIGSDTFSWTFASTDTSATQSAFQLVIQTSTGSAYYDSGKVPSTTSSTLVAFASGGDFQYQIRVWDDEDVVGPYTPFIAFSVHAQPIVVVTAPPTPLTVFHPTVNWTYTATGGGGAQKTFRLLVTDDRNADAVVYDSTTIPSSATTTVMGGPDVLTNAHPYTFTIIVTDQLNAQGFGTKTVVTQWAPPGTIANVQASLQQLTNPAGVTGGAQIATLDYASISWDPVTSGLSTFGYYQVSRTLVGVDLVEPLVPIAQITDPGVTVFNDFDLGRTVDASIQSIYSVSLYDTVRGLSAPPVSQPGVFGTAADQCDVYVTSNFSPQLNVAYMDKAPYEYTPLDTALIRQHQIFGRSYPQQFRSPNALGDSFSRTLLLGGANFSRPLAARGRAGFDPLLARIREATPYLCVQDGMGRRWYGGIAVTKLHYEAEFEAYAADVTVTELSGTPMILVAAQPWSAG